MQFQVCFFFPSIGYEWLGCWVLCFQTSLGCCSLFHTVSRHSLVVCGVTRVDFLIELLNERVFKM